jgi:hypothetical protein
MRHIFNYQNFICRSPDDGGGTPAAAAPAAPAASPAGAQNSPPAGDGAPPPSAASAAPAATPPAAGASFYRPADLPDNMVGKTLEETMDNMAKSLKGYRDRDASKPAPPADAAAYLAFDAEPAAEIKPYIETLAADPLVKSMNEYALEKGIPKDVYQGLITRFLSAGRELGLMEPPVDPAAERAALLPDNAKHLTPAEQSAAIERRMNDNFAFVDLMTQGPNALAKDDAEYLKAMLGDNAKGHRALEHFRARIQPPTSGGPAMGQPGAGGVDVRAELARRAGLPENTPGNPKYDRASHEQLVADYKREHGK